MRKPFSVALLLLGLTLTAGQGLAAQFDRLQASALTSVNATRSLLLDIQIPPGSERLVAAGEQGTILYSDDQGASWQQAKTPVSVLLTALSFSDAQLGWAVGHDGTILHSRDGGLSWQLQRSGLQLVELQRDTLQGLIDAPADNIDTQQLDDWQYQLEDVQFALEEGAMPVLLDVLFTDNQHGFALGSYGALFETEDGGEHWQSIGYRLPNPDRLHLNTILLSRSGRLLIAGEAGLLLYSDDRGEFWQWAESPYQGSLFGISESDRLYLMGLRGHLFSSDDGIQWQAQAVPGDATLNSGIDYHGRLYVLGQSGLLLAQKGEGFSALAVPNRRSFTAAVALHDRLWLVGEGGLSQIELKGGAQ
ncbi:photosystem I reaction center subunit IV [Marinobacterium sp. D7]|uniref:WD40/YVTN/BNR-like repeat-containing protein n=1 Tax=Marinobacterium ramblicola TaxID=2849041 RepID=UPI001C2D92C5|nr:YCF48-related protein [Marinobacterium ramblicola]MBV1788272.1 photosystem I reaction center subunit IV [Marinobacterium ramblicola]